MKKFDVRLILEYNPFAKPYKPKEVMALAKAKIEAAGGKIIIDGSRSWGFVYEAPNQVIEPDREDDFRGQLKIKKVDTKVAVDSEEGRLPTAEELASEEADE
ncbi:hypothetical protein PRZ48_002269 [Zasmidium cellare]|uniref:Uncharacterized protein n=1 Tax=Zasmidium cellare TaxID=395010 RepID=A0ABR0F5M1_ZASCE|nr:hypothetical protein PRZ48_002269 [Zasmidium cellare]